ncbi:MAG: single-stranded-DNA-specific exonuclease RecJ [Candidatus Sericytochromatia bacterium]
MSDWPELHVPSPDARTNALADALGVSALLAQLLVNRDISAEEARWMLEETPPLVLPEVDFTPEVQALFQTLHAESAPIAIFGDYDADGLSGTAVLTAFLRGAGFAVTPLLPTRSQGYGLNPDSLRELATQGHRLLITVDCGISNASEITLAQELGLQVIVTDHHGLPEQLPEAAFVLHPAVLQLPELANLSGAGMAWWLTTLLHPVFPEAPSPEELLDLAVLGTLADMTPLRGLNFALAKRGLAAASRTRRPGLLALAELRQVDLDQLTEDNLTFRLIPMLNAAGRIQSPRPALELLLADNADTAKRLAAELQELNTLRQQLCQQVLDDALAQLEATPPTRAIVMAEAHWPHGVLGITCSQLVDRYHLPVALLAIEGETAKASVRCPKGYHVLEALQGCADLLLRFGGHEMAGGFSIDTAHIPAFQDRFAALCDAQQDGTPHRVHTEMEINPSLLNLARYDELRRLAPFGMGNPTPVFLSLNVPLRDTKPDRKQRQHFFARLDNGPEIKAWRQWDDSYAPETFPSQRFDLLYGLQRTTWQDRTRLELNVNHLRPHRVAAPARPNPADPLPPSNPGAPSARPKQAPSANTTAPRRPVLRPAGPPLPGWFFDGLRWWLMPSRTEDLSPHWEERRDLGSRAFASGTVLRYAPERPYNATARLAEAGQFDCLYLDTPPDPDVAAALWRSFDRIQIGPWAPLTPLPGFQDFAPLLSWLQDHPGPRDASELAQWRKLSLQQAELWLKSLSELGLLAYDRERYRIQYKNQLYDLRQSPTFQHAHALWRYRSDLALDWQNASLERLKNRLLHPGKAIHVEH